jgi:hypothetical protein
MTKSLCIYLFLTDFFKKIILLRSIEGDSWELTEWGKMRRLLKVPGRSVILLTH